VADRAKGIVRHLRRTVLGVTGIVVMAGLLAACDPLALANAPLSIRMQSGAFELAVCQPVHVVGVLLESRSSDLGAQWKEVWVASGDVDLAATTVLTSDHVPEGLTAKSWGSPTLVGRGNITITLSKPGGTLDAFIAVPDTGIPDELWLHDDGSLTRGPSETTSTP
jgi:hypothetical protein